MKTIKQTFDEIAEAKQKRTLVKALKEHDSYVVRSILQANFNPKISFPFPSGEPPYEHNDQEVEVTKEMFSKLGGCTKNAKGQLIHKEMTFINFLEKVHVEDAKLICLMKDGELETLYPKITEEVVKEAFPDLL
jgi:hypothetical protein